MITPVESVSTEELLSHANWLRRLALGLGAEGADDLVQETFTAALRRPPRGGEPVRPWLARVLKNFWLMRRRGEGVRAARRAEVAATGPTSPPGADELLDRLQTQRALARIVAELDEPFRETILLRYYEDMSCADIARLKGMPAGTVRWRLKTALDRVRAGLDAELGDRRRWQRALAPLLVRPLAPRPTLWPAAAILSAFALVWLGLWASWNVAPDLSLSGIPDSPATAVADLPAADQGPGQS